MRQTNADLKRYYRMANRLYFGNALPELPMRFARMYKRTGITWTEGGEAVSIEVNEVLRGYQAITIMVVLHEMLHVEKPQHKGHGWQFDKRMLRLAKMGAFGGLW